MASEAPNILLQPTQTSLIPPGMDSIDFSELFSFGTSPLRDAQFSLDLSSSSKVNSNGQIREEGSPEPPDPLVIQTMREKLLAMGIVDPPTAMSKETITTAIDIGQRERELAEMVLYLTNPSFHPLPSQIVDQATTISELVRQRDTLLQSREQEREIWEAEKESWDRITGALSARRFADGTYRADVLERDNLRLMSDNRLLKHKLQEQQSRIDSLENELRILRPFLLLPAGSIRTAILSGPQRPRGRRTRDRDIRFLDNDAELHHKRGHNPAKISSTGDARSEHILLASRKLGRQRVAAIIPTLTVSTPALSSFDDVVQALRNKSPTKSQAPPSAESEDMEEDELDQDDTPPSPPSPPASRTKAPTTPRPARKLFPSTTTPRTPRTDHPTSPERTLRSQQPPTTPQKRPEQSENPLVTPIDHLINAGRILGNQAASPTRSVASAIDGSPMKRRRMEEDGFVDGDGEDDNDAARAHGAMSALDVLAEQAAVVISQSPKKAVDAGVVEGVQDLAPPPTGPSPEPVLSLGATNAPTGEPSSGDTGTTPIGI